MEIPEQHLIDSVLSFANDMHIKAQSVTIDDSSKGQQEYFAKLKNNTITISAKAAREYNDIQMETLLTTSLFKPYDSKYSTIFLVSLVPFSPLIKHFKSDPYIALALVFIWLFLFGLVILMQVRAYKRFEKMLEYRASRTKKLLQQKKL